MSYSGRETVDFEQWSELASEDPAAFEERRREMIEAVIEAASQRCQQRLRGLQWRIDQMRTQAPNPMAACISLSKMMWESFAGEDGLTETLNRAPAPCQRSDEGATILPFPVRRK